MPRPQGPPLPPPTAAVLGVTLEKTARSFLSGTLAVHARQGPLMAAVGRVGGLQPAPVVMAPVMAMRPLQQRAGPRHEQGGMLCLPRTPGCRLCVSGVLPRLHWRRGWVASGAGGSSRAPAVDCTRDRCAAPSALWAWRGPTPLRLRSTELWPASRRSRWLDRTSLVLNALLMPRLPCLSKRDCPENEVAARAPHTLAPLPCASQ